MSFLARHEEYCGVVPAAESQVPDQQFKWRDSKKNWHVPKAMQTRHLFMTLVLIWNHKMPEEMRIARSGRWKHHQYRLGSFYTDDYLKQAIRVLTIELAKRKDIEPEWQETLDKIKSHLQRGQIT